NPNALLFPVTVNSHHHAHHRPPLQVRHAGTGESRRRAISSGHSSILLYTGIRTPTILSVVGVTAVVATLRALLIVGLRVLDFNGPLRGVRRCCRRRYVWRLRFLGV